MFQIDNSTAATAQPAPTSPGTPGFFTDGNPLTGVAPTIVPAEFLNAVMLEMCNIVTGAGLALSKASFTQLRDSIKRICQKTVVLTDTGSANTYVATNSPALSATDLVSGLLQQVSIKVTNTGAATYSPDGLSAAPIYGLALQPLQGGELPAGGIAVLMRATIGGVNGGNPIWILTECAGGAQQIASGTAANHAMQLGQSQTQAGTAFTAAGVAPAYTLTPSPSISAYSGNQRFNVTFPTAGTTGSNTISVNGLGAIPLKQFAPDGSVVSATVTAGMNSDVQIVGAGSYALLLDPLPAPGGSYAGRQLLSGTQTLTASQAGMLLYGNSNTAFTVTLPQALTLPTSPQLAYYFYNYAVGPMTIAMSNTDIIGFKNGTTATSVVLQQGDSLVVCAYGSGNAYLAVGGTFQLQYSPAFLTAVAANSSSAPARSTLAVSYTGTSGVVSTTANAITLQNGTGAALTLTGWSQSATSGNASGVVNSLDTGNWAFGTWYNLYGIYNPTTQTRGLLWSLSATAPILPAGFTYYCRLGANKTQSATNYWFLGGTQDDRKFQYKPAAGSNVTTLPIMASGTTSGVTTAVATGAYVPPTASGIRVSAQVTTVGQACGAAPNATYVIGVSGVIMPIIANTAAGMSGGSAVSGEFLLESTNIYWSSTGGQLACLGWEDNL